MLEGWRGRSAVRASPLLAGALLVLLTAPGPACDQPCTLLYSGSVSIPSSAQSLDCTVTFKGATGTASFDCPAGGVPTTNTAGCSADCTPQAGLSVGGVSRVSANGSTGGSLVVTDAGPTCTFPEGGSASASSAQTIAIHVQDGLAEGEASDATNLKNALGGTDFSLTVQCGGGQVAQLQDQTIGQDCDIGD